MVCRVATASVGELMADWFDGRMTAFDCETTGVDVEESRIVQSALVSVGGGEPTRKSVLLIDPGVEIPEGASAVHGITTEKARAEGQPAAASIQHVRMGLCAAIKAQRPIVAFNARFDLTLLDRECRRHRIDPPDWSQALVFDPFVCWKWADRFRRGSRNLAAACEAYGIDLGEDAHDAAADALAAVRLAWRFTHKSDFVQGKHPEIIERRALWKRIRGDLPALHQVQVAWAGAQASSLREYFLSKGKVEEAATVQEEWPVVPVSVRP